MKYVYNKERDRLACRVWDPRFYKATYEDKETKEKRVLILHTCTDQPDHVKTVVTNFANEKEQVTNISAISRNQYENWLCGAPVLTIKGKEIPASFITTYLLAEDSPSPQKRNGRYGNLSHERELLLERDENLLQDIMESWDLADSKNDIIRTNTIEIER